MLEAAEVRERADHRIGAEAEQRIVVGRAVVLVGQDDHAERRRATEEAGVGALGERGLQRREVLLEAAAVDADVGDTREGVGQRAGVVGDAATRRADHVAEEASAAERRTRRAVHPTAVAAALVAARIAGVDAAGAHVGGDDADVQIRAPRAERVEPRDQFGEPVLERVVLLQHRAGVVDDEQQIELAVEARRQRLLLDRLRRRNHALDRSVDAGESRQHEGKSHGRGTHGDLSARRRGHRRATRTSHQWRTSPDPSRHQTPTPKSKTAQRALSRSILHSRRYCAERSGPFREGDPFRYAKWGRVFAKNPPLPSCLRRGRRPDSRGRRCTSRTGPRARCCPAPRRRRGRPRSRGCWARSRSGPDRR